MLSSHRRLLELASGRISRDLLRGVVVATRRRFATSSSQLLRTTRPARRADEATCSADEDAPVALPANPYARPPKQCLLCRTGTELDYKNARLLQQFVSNFSGRVYDRHITGLCDGQQKRLLETIAAGYMPVMVKDPKYLKDPRLFDPLRPLRSHSFA